MSDILEPDMEIQLGSPMGGAECMESHMMEPQVQLDEELDQSSLEPSVELVEPQVEIEEGGDHAGNVYPLDTLSVEFYEGAENAADSTSSNYAHEDSGAQDFQQSYPDDLPHSTEGTSMDPDASQSSMEDASLDEDVSMGDSTAADESYTDGDETNYNDMQRTYLEDLFSSNTSTTASVDDESTSSPSFERIPLSRFPTITKVVERAEYETIQILYQLLYQRSAWDTQEILSQRILEFSGFNFSKSSEEYYNREMMLQTLPNSILVKIGAILCLDQVKNVLSNLGLGRQDLITAIMEFLAVPRRRTRGPRTALGKPGSSEAVEPCGCRSNCLSKFKIVEREFLATYHTSFKEKKKSEAYFVNLVTVNKSKRGIGASKKHRDYKYNYKIKLGKKEVNVCKGGFMMLHNIKMSRLNQIQAKLKKGTYFPNALLSSIEYPCAPGMVDEEPPPQPEVRSEENLASNSVENSSESSSSKFEDETSKNEETLLVDEEIKKSLIKKVPAVVVEKIDPNKIKYQKERIYTSSDNSSSSIDTKDSTDDNVASSDKKKKKLKDFPLVVTSLNEVSEELLIDLHFLLFLSSAENNKLQQNILEFDGFSFTVDSEEYDERKEFLQRMSGKLLTEVARSFSLGVLSKREETIQNILSFLMKPNESYLRTTTVPVILSDVELDDIDGFSDSDESITCEVVEKKVECIDLLSSGEDSDKEGGGKKKKERAEGQAKVSTPPAKAVTQTPVQTPAPPVQNTVATATPKSVGGIRKLKDFETIRKIVNTHPPEYLVDIYELLFLKKHDFRDPDALRNEILDFTGFKFEKGTPEYVKRKQVLDRMLYNNVRRVYNTLIHNSTEVKVFSKPTMINEIFQFLFKLPDHDTSVRPLPPGAKTLMPKTPSLTPKPKTAPLATAPPATAPASILPSQAGKLSDLKRVFQRVACFPCEYLVDVHKLLFMTDCDPKVIRQNIFGFKGFSFSVDSSEFQQRKMYLEYLTFHSLRKISSVLTTRSVDLRNSTKHELASHLTDVLAEYCNTVIETEPVAHTADTATATSTPRPTIVMPVKVTNTTPLPKKDVQKPEKVPSSNDTLKISIVETRSISSPAVSTPSIQSVRGGRKRKNQTVRQLVTGGKKAAPTPPSAPTDFADIHLPEVEQYQQIYGTNLNVSAGMYPDMLEQSLRKFQINSEPRKEPSNLYGINSSLDNTRYNELLRDTKLRSMCSVVLTRINVDGTVRNLSHNNSSGFRPKEQNYYVPYNPIRYPAQSYESFPFTPSQSTRTFDPNQLLVINNNITGTRVDFESFTNPNVPTITGIASFGSSSYPQLVPQTMTFPLVSSYQVSGIQQTPQMLGLQSTAITMNAPIITQVSTKMPETIISADVEMTSEDPQNKAQGNDKSNIPKTSPSKEGSNKDNSPSKDSEEDGDKPLASLIGHPIDSVLEKHISDIVKTTDLQDITMNGVIKRIYAMYPKFDLSYRKDFIKSTLRSILYKLGDEKQETARDSNSPDCSVTTTDINDCSLPESETASP